MTTLPARATSRLAPAPRHLAVVVLSLYATLSACESPATPAADAAPTPTDRSVSNDTASDLGDDAVSPTMDAMDVGADLADVSLMDAPREGGMRRDGGDDGGDAVADMFTVDVFTDELLSAPEMLARPTDRSIAVHVVPTRAVEFYFEYGTTSGTYTGRTEMRTAAAREPSLTTLTGLTPATRYYYRMRHRAPGASTFEARAEHSFTTRRPRGATFTFTVQADSHLDDRSDLGVYQSTLDHVLGDRPDFHVDLGDTFMCEKHTVPFMAATEPSMDAPTVDARYAFDRANFARIGHSVPVFLVNGNHEGESGWFLDGTANNIAVWATLSRKRYFANPEADMFYSASTTAEPLVGTRQSYYAFEWGDALFVTLDPYWYTRQRPTADRWRWTLGEEQYRWLRRTLEGSTARYKFIFLHHLLGGVNSEARGGVEAAPFFEWGGLNEDRSPGFDAHRPGWGASIHQVLRDTHVTAVFHGHDHVYVRQELDGIVYQEVPQPSASNFVNGATLAMEGGYTSGTVRSSSGHLRVTVSPDRAVVDYVRATPPAGMRIPDGGADGDTYTLMPR